MDAVLTDLGPKENPNKESTVRIIPPARVVGEGLFFLSSPISGRRLSPISFIAEESALSLTATILSVKAE